MRWIIGDIHGMLRPLETLLEAISRADSSPRFYFAGDFANRGPDSRGVIDLVLSLPEARCVRGNHDDILDQILNGASFAENAAEGDRLAAFQWFMQFGLDDTFLSYGADLAQLEYAARQASMDRLQGLIDLVPPAHRQFFRDLPAVIEEEDLFVTHGHWDTDMPDHAPGLASRLQASGSLRYRLLWGRYGHEEALCPKAWGRTGYFGHTPVYSYDEVDSEAALLPLQGPKIVLLDTAAALLPAGRLTAFCADSGQFFQASHFGFLVEQPAHR